MYAIVKTGGKQYRVEEGQTLLVEKLDAEAGSKLDLETLLLAGDEPVFGKAVEKAKVSAEIVEHVKGPKLRIFKHKPKRGYKRRTGHRQNLTKIKILSLSATGGGAAASASAAKPAAAKPAAAKKPAAKTTPAKKATA
jgi:large subunit ribosomal protein L21